MKLRQYLPDLDYSCLSEWINDERMHAFWCANLLQYPIARDSFHHFLQENSMKWADQAYVATEDTGQAVGFFCYSVSAETRTGFIKFIIIDPAKRGKGYGRKMLNLALQYAFSTTGAEAVQLNVFHENTIAKRCYEKVGFLEKRIEPNIFSYKNELWSRCNMQVEKQQWSLEETVLLQKGIG